MWVLTTSGFFSAVEHRHDPDLVIVRARARDDLTALSSWAATDIVDSPDADYPYRTTVRKQAFADWLCAQATAIDYPNFKNAVANRQGNSRAGIYHHVWAVLRGLSESIETG